MRQARLGPHHRVLCQTSEVRIGPIVRARTATAPCSDTNGVHRVYPPFLFRISSSFSRSSSRIFSSADFFAGGSACRVALGAGWVFPLFAMKDLAKSFQ